MGISISSPFGWASSEHRSGIRVAGCLGTCFAVWVTVGCSGSSTTASPGGNIGQGGSGAGGTAAATGGASLAATGGARASGGALASGGTPGTGGTTAVATGGTRATIGGGTSAMPTGGHPSAGGGTSIGSGGKIGSGGAIGAGGTSGLAGGSTGNGGGATSGYPLGNPAELSSGCSKTLSTFKTGQNNYTITSSGKSRQYTMTIPTGYDPTHPYRLIFGMHWMNGSASAVVGEGYYKLLPLDTGNTTIFVAPQGNSSGAAWNTADATDQTFFEDMVTLFESSLCIDTTRIFAAGFSYGAMFSNSLGRNHQLSNPSPKNVLRGVAVYETAIRNIYQGTPTGNPMAWWGQVGMSDTTCTPADGRAARDEWVKNNGCTGTPTEWKSGNHVCYSYTCPANYPVRWCTFNGGHTDWVNDSGSSTPWEPNETWNFFKQF
jgi:poly(3-hydroxybutyrate) depolymerase